MTTPHNPANIQPSEGCRLLDEDEVSLKVARVCLPKIECWEEDLQAWNQNYLGCSRGNTYQTTLSRAALRAARGLEPEPIEVAIHAIPLEVIHAMLGKPEPESEVKTCPNTPAQETIRGSNAASSSDPKLTATPRTSAFYAGEKESDDEHFARNLERETITLRQQLDSALANNAALKEVLELGYNSFRNHDTDEVNYDRWQEKASIARVKMGDAISSPSPGAPLLAKLTRLREELAAIRATVSKLGYTENEDSTLGMVTIICDMLLTSESSSTPAADQFTGKNTVND